MSNFMKYEKDVRRLESFGSKRRFDNFVVFVFAFDTIEYKYIGFRMFKGFMRAQSFAYYWSKQKHNNMSRIRLLQGSMREVEFINGSRCVY